MNVVKRRRSSVIDCENQNPACTDAINFPALLGIHSSYTVLLVVGVLLLSHYPVLTGFNNIIIIIMSRVQLYVGCGLIWCVVPICNDLLTRDTSCAKKQYEALAEFIIKLNKKKKRKSVSKRRNGETKKK